MSNLSNEFRKTMMFILLLLVAEPLSLTVRDKTVNVRFVNNKNMPVHVHTVSGKQTRDSIKILAGQTAEKAMSLGQRIRVEFDVDKSMFFEVTQPKSQEFVLGPTHSMFDLLGWEIHLHDDLWQRSPELIRVWFDLMVGQLTRVVDAVPEPALRKLQEVPIWVNPPYSNARPTAEYHPSADWLKNNNREPGMAQSIEITNTDNFAFENVRMPYLLLHELSHAYHDRVLGFRHPGIRAKYEHARQQGSYEKVDRFTGRRIVKDRAYALSNEKEYFAENSEAFFGKNDFYPFNRQQLLKHDKPMHNLLIELWGIQLQE